MGLELTTEFDKFTNEQKDVIHLRRESPMLGGWLWVDKVGEVGVGSSTSEGAVLAPSAPCNSRKSSRVRPPALQVLLVPAQESLWKA